MNQQLVRSKRACLDAYYSHVCMRYTEQLMFLNLVIGCMPFDLRFRIIMFNLRELHQEGTDPEQAYSVQAPHPSPSHPSIPHTLQLAASAVMQASKVSLLGKVIYLLFIHTSYIMMAWIAVKGRLLQHVAESDATCKSLACILPCLPCHASCSQQWIFRCSSTPKYEEEVEFKFA